MQGSDLEVADHKGRTALHHASVGGKTEVLQMLLEAGGSLQAQDNFAASPLYLAVKNHFPSAAHLLLSRGVSIALARTHCCLIAGCS